MAIQGNPKPRLAMGLQKTEGDTSLSKLRWSSCCQGETLKSCLDQELHVHVTIITLSTGLSCCCRGDIGPVYHPTSTQDTLCLPIIAAPLLALEIGDMRRLTEVSRASKTSVA